MSAGKNPSGIVFGPRRGTRVVRRVRALLYVAVLFGAAVLVGWLVVAVREHVFPSRPLLGYGIGAALGLLLILASWRSILARFQDTVEITPGTIHFGSGWARESFSLDAVEVIRLGTAWRTDPQYRKGIEIQTSGRHRTLLLDGQEQECARALNEHCPCAVYIDTEGAEHMPRGEDRPLSVLDNLARERQRRSWARLAAALAILPAAALGLLYFLTTPADDATPGRLELAVLVPLLLVCGLALLLVAVAGIYRAWRLGAHIQELCRKHSQA